MDAECWQLICRGLKENKTLQDLRCVPAGSWGEGAALDSRCCDFRRLNGHYCRGPGHVGQRLLLRSWRWRGAARGRDTATKHNPAITEVRGLKVPWRMLQREGQSAQHRPLGFRHWQCISPFTVRDVLRPVPWLLVTATVRLIAHLAVFTTQPLGTQVPRQSLKRSPPTGHCNTWSTCSERVPISEPPHPPRQDSAAGGPSSRGPCPPHASLARKMSDFGVPLCSLEATHIGDRTAAAIGEALERNSMLCVLAYVARTELPSVGRWGNLTRASVSCSAPTIRACFTAWDEIPLATPVYAPSEKG